MKKSTLILLILLFAQFTNVMAVEFSVKEKSIIYTNSIKVLQDYQTIINQIGEFVINDIDKAKSSSESFLELFANRQVLIFNDLDPAHKLSEFYEAETYASNIILWYPDGMTISLNLDNARVSEILTHGENVYSIDILAEKSINGNYLNETLNKNTEELTFRIAFGLENRSLNNFRIVGIRNSATNYVIDYTQALREVNSVDLSDEDISKIRGELKAVLNDYTNFLSLVGDPQEIIEEKEFYKASFIKLFESNDTRVYNDINPEPQTSLISITDYLTGIITDYPNGIRNLSLNIDSAKFGKVMKTSEVEYYTYVDANKFFSGSYKGRDAFRKMFPLIFKISFSASGKTFTNFIINSIDISTVNFYESTTSNIGEEKPVTIIRPVTRKGFGMSLIGSLGQTHINDKDITSLSLDKNLHSWESTPLYGYLTSIGISYYFNDNIAVRSGIEFNNYSEKFRLTGKFTNTDLSTDINSDSYFSIVEANYDSLISINYLTLPVLINYTSGKPGKICFFAEGGLKISLPVKASYKLSGSYKTSGYYPSNPTVIQYLDIPELGFYAREDLSETRKYDMKGFNVAFYSSVGISLPLGYYSSISFGPELNIGLSDILSDKKNYVDIFGKTYTHQPTKIKNFGIRISLAYKL